MPCFFGNPGRVMAVAAPELALPMTMEMECWSRDAGRQFKAIITQVSVSNQGGFQFMHSLRQYVYLYIFGERVGELTVSGLTFGGGCISYLGMPSSGIEAVMMYYNTMRATNRACPVNIRIATLAFRGFLLGVKTDIVDPDSGLGHFTFRFYTPPTDLLGFGTVLCPDDTCNLSQPTVTTIGTGTLSPTQPVSIATNSTAVQCP